MQCAPAMESVHRQDLLCCRGVVAATQPSTRLAPAAARPTPPNSLFSQDNSNAHYVNPDSQISVQQGRGQFQPEPQGTQWGGSQQQRQQHRGYMPAEADAPAKHHSSRTHDRDLWGDDTPLRGGPPPPHHALPPGAATGRAHPPRHEAAPQHMEPAVDRRKAAQAQYAHELAEQMRERKRREAAERNTGADDGGNISLPSYQREQRTQPAHQRGGDHTAVPSQMHDRPHGSHSDHQYGRQSAPSSNQAANNTPSTRTNAHSDAFPFGGGAQRGGGAAADPRSKAKVHAQELKEQAEADAERKRKAKQAEKVYERKKLNEGGAPFGGGGGRSPAQHQRPPLHIPGQQQQTGQGGMQQPQYAAPHSSADRSRAPAPFDALSPAARAREAMQQGGGYFPPASSDHGPIHAPSGGNGGVTRHPAISLKAAPSDPDVYAEDGLFAGFGSRGGRHGGGGGEPNRRPPSAPYAPPQDYNDAVAMHPVTVGGVDFSQVGQDAQSTGRRDGPSTHHSEPMGAQHQPGTLASPPRPVAANLSAAQVKAAVASGVRFTRGGGTGGVDPAQAERNAAAAVLRNQQAEDLKLQIEEKNRRKRAEQDAEREAERREAAKLEAERLQLEAKARAEIEQEIAKEGDGSPPKHLLARLKELKAKGMQGGHTDTGGLTGGVMRSPGIGGRPRARMGGTGGLSSGPNSPEQHASGGMQAHLHPGNDVGFRPDMSSPAGGVQSSNPVHDAVQRMRGGGGDRDVHFMQPPHMNDGRGADFAPPPGQWPQSHGADFESGVPSFPPPPRGNFNPPSSSDSSIHAELRLLQQQQGMLMEQLRQQRDAMREMQEGYRRAQQESEILRIKSAQADIHSRMMGLTGGRSGGYTPAWGGAEGGHYDQYGYVRGFQGVGPHGVMPLSGPGVFGAEGRGDHFPHFYEQESGRQPPYPRQGGDRWGTQQELGGRDVSISDELLGPSTHVQHPTVGSPLRGSQGGGLVSPPSSPLSFNAQGGAWGFDDIRFVGGDRPRTAKAGAMGPKGYTLGSGRHGGVGGGTSGTPLVEQSLDGRSTLRAALDAAAQGTIADTPRRQDAFAALAGAEPPLTTTKAPPASRASREAYVQDMVSRYTAATAGRSDLDSDQRPATARIGEDSGPIPDIESLKRGTSGVEKDVARHRRGSSRSGGVEGDEGATRPFSAGPQPKPDALDRLEASFRDGFDQFASQSVKGGPRGSAAPPSSARGGVEASLDGSAMFVGLGGIGTSDGRNMVGSAAAASVTPVQEGRRPSSILRAAGAQSTASNKSLGSVSTIAGEGEGRVSRGPSPGSEGGGTSHGPPRPLSSVDGMSRGELEVALAEAEAAEVQLQERLATLEQQRSVLKQDLKSWEAAYLAEHGGVRVDKSGKLQRKADYKAYARLKAETSSLVALAPLAARRIRQLRTALGTAQAGTAAASAARAARQVLTKDTSERDASIVSSFTAGAASEISAGTSARDADSQLAEARLRRDERSLSLQLGVWTREVTRDQGGVPPTPEQRNAEMGEVVAELAAVQASLIDRDLELRSSPVHHVRGGSPDDTDYGGNRSLDFNVSDFTSGPAMSSLSVPAPFGGATHTHGGSTTEQQNSTAEHETTPSGLATADVSISSFSPLPTRVPGSFNVAAASIPRAEDEGGEGGIRSVSATGTSAFNLRSDQAAMPAPSAFGYGRSDTGRTTDTDAAVESEMHKIFEGGVGGLHASHDSSEVSSVVDSVMKSAQQSVEGGSSSISSPAAEPDADDVRSFFARVHATVAEMKARADASDDEGEPRVTSAEGFGDATEHLPDVAADGDVSAHSASFVMGGSGLVPVAAPHGRPASGVSSPVPDEANDDAPPLDLPNDDEIAAAMAGLSATVERSDPAAVATTATAAGAADSKYDEDWEESDSGDDEGVIGSSHSPPQKATGGGVSAHETPEAGDHDDMVASVRETGTVHSEDTGGVDGAKPPSSQQRVSRSGSFVSKGGKGGGSDSDGPPRSVGGRLREDGSLGSSASVGESIQEDTLGGAAGSPQGALDSKQADSEGVDGDEGGSQKDTTSNDDSASDEAGSDSGESKSTGAGGAATSTATSSTGSNHSSQASSAEAGEAGDTSSSSSAGSAAASDSPAASSVASEGEAGSSGSSGSSDGTSSSGSKGASATPDVAAGSTGALNAESQLAATRIQALARGAAARRSNEAPPPPIQEPLSVAVDGGHATEVVQVQPAKQPSGQAARLLAARQAARGQSGLNLKGVQGGSKEDVPQTQQTEPPSDAKSVPASESVPSPVRSALGAAQQAAAAAQSIDLHSAAAARRDANAARLAKRGSGNNLQQTVPAQVTAKPGVQPVGPGGKLQSGGLLTGDSDSDGDHATVAVRGWQVKPSEVHETSEGSQSAGQAAGGGEQGAEGGYEDDFEADSGAQEVKAESVVEAARSGTAMGSVISEHLPAASPPSRISQVDEDISARPGSRLADSAISVPELVTHDALADSQAGLDDSIAEDAANLPSRYARPAVPLSPSQPRTPGRG